VKKESLSQRNLPNLIKARLMDLQVDVNSKIYRKLPQDISETYTVFLAAKDAIMKFTQLQFTKKNRVELTDKILELYSLHFVNNYTSLIHALDTLILERSEIKDEYRDELTLDILRDISRKYHLNSANEMVNKVRRMYNYPFSKRLEQWGIATEGKLRDIGGDFVDMYEILYEVTYAIEIFVSIEPRMESKDDMIALLRIIYRELLFDYPFHFMRLVVALDDN